jgi:endothelin-converting enzyme/putative endopeptidase
MKSVLTGALCSSVLLLSACGDKTQVETKQTTEKVAEKSDTTPVLTSGINLANLDKTVRPQDDIYTYTNGIWLKTAVIPDNKTAIGAFGDLRDMSDEDVKVIIEELSDQENLVMGSDEQKVGDLFSSYMNMDKRNELGTKPILTELKKISALENKDQLASYFAQAEEIGINTPLSFYIGIDAKNSNSYATHIWQSGLGLPDRDYYFDKGERPQRFRDAYVAHIQKIFELAGLENSANAAQTVMAIETKLAGFHRTRVKNRDSEARYNKFAVSDLNAVTSNFNWANYLASQGVTSTTDIILNQPDYIAGFGNVFATTSLADWKTYMTWHLVDTFAGLMNDELDKQNFEFYGKVLNGRKKQQPMWKRGVQLVNGTLGEVIGKIYVSRHFNESAKKRMSELVENLRSAYSESINALDWMSADTKQAAQVKLAAFTPKIGYPDRWKDYSALSINAEQLVGNIIRARKLVKQLDLEKLGGPIRTWEWGMTPQTVNAYYSPTRNEIVFPAAILQPPFFNMKADDAVNYGGIGAVIGHEMGHGFDDQGSRYNGEGNLVNWWTAGDLEEFKKRSAKLVSQYSAYKVYDDLNINGELTLGENIGDLSGATIAYRAYQKSLKGKSAPVIDGLTGDQRFFIGFAQIWRGKRTEEGMRNRVKNDPHSPAKFRAIGALSNMPEFYKAFDLKPGDAMYIAPEDRVKIW